MSGKKGESRGGDRRIACGGRCPSRGKGDGMGRHREVSGDTVFDWTDAGGSWSVRQRDRSEGSLPTDDRRGNGRNKGEHV